LEIIEGDVTNISRLVSAARGCSAIVHLAGIVGDSACRLDEKTALHCNIVATRMLYEVARSFGVPRFIFASSCSVYGNNPKTVDENSPLNPISLYAETKIESERQLLSAIDDYFIVTILRFATVFGDSRRPRFDLVANLFAAQAFTTGRISVFGGSQRRPFIHAADVARAVLLTLNTKPSTVQGQIYNIGDGNLNATIAELAQLVAKAVEKIRPVEIDLVEGCEDLRDYNVSFQKVKDHLGFEASISLEQGIEEIVRNLSEGKYGDYTSARYNNLEVTKKVLLDQQDPQQSGMLYAPINTYDNE
jgi:nucleoside-diphosphate-sugar epimerase